jgi:hypothetical protein
MERELLEEFIEWQEIVVKMRFIFLKTKVMQSKGF